VEEYSAMQVMTAAMPNLQQLAIGDLDRHSRYDSKKYNDGEDPDEVVAARTADWPTYDIEIISNFSKLRVLEIEHAELNGRYPFLFNSFPLLERLFINTANLKWDLGMLAGLPMLKDVECYYQHCLTGNINSLRALKDTLEKVKINYSGNIEGNFMDLADFPHLKELVLDDFKSSGFIHEIDEHVHPIKGDIRDIGENDFTSLEKLHLRKGVYGGNGYELQRISDAPDLVRAVYRLRKQRPALEYYRTKFAGWYGILSEDSPDRFAYAYNAQLEDTPPFYIRLVEAGSRIGYRWETEYRNPCEVNWLDPEPDRESSGYDEYIEGLQRISRQVNMYRGFHQPPTEEEYLRAVEEHTQRLEEERREERRRNREFGIEHYYADY
jgi:hypothetical protein